MMALQGLVGCMHHHELWLKDWNNNARRAKATGELAPAFTHKQMIALIDALQSREELYKSKEVVRLGGFNVPESLPPLSSAMTGTCLRCVFNGGSCRAEKQSRSRSDSRGLCTTTTQTGHCGQAKSDGWIPLRKTHTKRRI